MKTILIASLVAAAAMGAYSQVPETRLPEARLTVRVLDEAGQPVSNAIVQFMFKDPLTRKGVLVEGPSDAQGLFSGEGGSDGQIGGAVRMDGYYRSGFPFRQFSAVKDGHWQPWDATYITTLRPVGKPVALYAKQSWIEIPLVGEPHGYDLQKGDWAAPHGKGSVADLIFKLERRYISRENFQVEVELSFSNARDGIQEVQWPAAGRYSVFKWPRQAPEAGFEPFLRLHFSRDPKAGFRQSFSEDQGYFFRVRTVEQNGKIISALYGKIKGGIQLAPSNSKTCKVNLTYYLNPSPLDRNLEWDTKHNLLMKLRDLESPREP